MWRTVLKLEPKNVDCWNAVGDVQLADEAWGDAAAALERSLALRSEQNDVRLRLGQAYEKLGRPDDAAAQYKAILRRRARDEGDGQARGSRGIRAGGSMRRKRCFARHSRRGPIRNGAITMRLGRVLAKRGDDAFHAERFTDAVAFYRSALSFDLRQDGVPRQISAGLKGEPGTGRPR